jgi:pimeloyl-ACP methyl ester carboxylesterase
MTVGPRLLLSAFVLKPTSSLLEWLAYHRAIGVTETAIFVDRREAGNQPLLDALAAAGAIRIIPVAVDPDIKEEIHNSAMRAGRLEGAATGGYGLYLAPDEYFCITDPAQTLPLLMQSCDADVLSAPVHFGGITPKRPHIPGGVLQHSIPLIDAARPSAMRSVTRLGLFSSRTPERPTGPVQGEKAVTLVDGDGVVTPAPHGLATGTMPEPAPAGRKASVLKIPAPSVETYLVNQQALPAKQHPGVEIQIARLEALTATQGKRWTLDMRQDATAAQIAMLMALPDVGAAQAALCAEETATRETLRENTADFQRVIAALNGEALPPEPVVAPHDDSIAEDDPRPEGDAKLPPWFAEIHTSGENEGFYTRLKNHAVSFVQRDANRLVVTFDNLSSVNDLSAEREPWAYKFVRDNGFSHLSVMARRKDWFRDPQLITYLQRLSTDGFFAAFDKVILTGTSMGGFAALAFASLSPGATVISFNPQTTLEEALVPWEERFGMGRARDWSLPHSDCAFEIGEVDKAFVFYDPFFAPDRRHVERLESDRLILLKTWCSGHFSPVFLRRAGLLKPLMQHAFDDTLTPAVFYKMIRARRSLPWYRKALIANLQERGHDQLAARVTPAFRKLRREGAK